MEYGTGARFLMKVVFRGLAPHLPWASVQELIEVVGQEDELSLLDGAEDEDDDDLSSDEDGALSLDRAIAMLVDSGNREKSKRVMKLRRKATNFQLRVLDILEIYISHAAKNGHALPVVRPLALAVKTRVEAAMGTRAGPTAKDLQKRVLSVYMKICSMCKACGDAALAERDLAELAGDMLTTDRTGVMSSVSSAG